MTPEQRAELIKKRDQLNEKFKGEFIDPKDMRRRDEIVSLLMTNGENKNITFKVNKRGRPAGTKGLNITKKYNRKGPVG